MERLIFSFKIVFKIIGIALASFFGTDENINTQKQTDTIVVESQHIKLMVPSIDNKTLSIDSLETLSIDSLQVSKKRETKINVGVEKS